MKLAIHHFFILVKPDGNEAELLRQAGMIESPGRVHKGQGTQNRLFHFANATLELLWVHDREEACHGPARDLKLYERSENPAASPFGLIFCRQTEAGDSMPFPGWHYQPDYFDPPTGFHVADTSVDTKEPLCIYMPFIAPGDTGPGRVEGAYQLLSNITVTVAGATLSPILQQLNETDRLSILPGQAPLLTLTFDAGAQGHRIDFRPTLPLVIHH